jgi:hypothetical protein
VKTFNAYLCQTVSGRPSGQRRDYADCIIPGAWKVLDFIFVTFRAFCILNQFQLDKSSINLSGRHNETNPIHILLYVEHNLLSHFVTFCDAE